MADFHKRLKELGAAWYGDKLTLYSRWVKAEATAKRNRELEAALQAQREEGQRATAGEAAAPRRMKAPEEPSAQERAEHELAHLPYKPWCLTCLRGKARADPHTRVEWTARAARPPMVQFDFAYLKSTGELCAPGPQAPQEAWATILVGVDENTRFPFALNVENKSESNIYMHKQCVQFINNTLRHKKVIIHTDGEPAIKSLARYIQIARKDHDTILEVAPRYSSGSTGMAENMIKRVAGQARTLRMSVEQRYHITIGVDMVVWPWLIRHASFLLARFDVWGTTQRTAFYQLNDYAYTSELAPFAETVLYRQSFPADRKGQQGSRIYKADPVWHRGIWWGRSEEGDEHVLGTPNGAVLARSVRRCAPSDQADVRLLEAVRGVPWDMRHGVAPGSLSPGATSPAAGATTRQRRNGSGWSTSCERSGRRRSGRRRSARRRSKQCSTSGGTCNGGTRGCTSASTSSSPCSSSTRSSSGFSADYGHLRIGDSVGGATGGASPATGRDPATSGRCFYQSADLGDSTSSPQRSDHQVGR